MKAKVILFNLPPVGGNLLPISLGYIAASLTKHGIDTALAEIDIITPKTGQSIANFVSSFKPILVGFSVYQTNIHLAVQLAKLIKMTNPKILVVIGGPQATFMPREALRQMPGVDVIVRGEGEVVLPEIVKCLIRKKDISIVQGIAFKRKGCIFETCSRPLTSNLDKFVSPYQYTVFDLSRQKTATMLTSRGCSFNCSFCYTPRAFQRKIREHSTSRVLGDMSVCIKNGISKFFFADPSFTFNKKRVEKIMKGIIKRGWKVQIWCETRADLVNKKLLTLMSKAGVNRIAYGLESVDHEVNSAINKRLDIKQFKDMVKAAQVAGMEVEIFTLYGLPGQTLFSALKTIKFVKSLGVKLVGNSAGQQLELFFGTDITNNPDKYGIEVVSRKRPLYLSSGIDFVTKSFKKKDMKLIKKCYRMQCLKDKKLGKNDQLAKLF